MEDIKIYKKVNTIRPAMVAGWPGMGSVALGVVDYLKRTLEATRFAEILMDDSDTLDSMVVEDGLAKFQEPPKNSFYYVKEHDLVIFEGEAQLAGHGGIGLLNKTLDLASQLNVGRIFTGAAFPMPIGHKDPSEVYAAVNKESLKSVASGFGLKPMEGGHISGLNGLLLGFAEKRNMEAMCLLATIPQYAVSMPNPKASEAIIEMLGKMLNFRIDLSELNGHIKEMDEQMSIIEDRVKDVFGASEHRQHRPGKKEAVIPVYVTDRIERLFQEAKADRKKAAELKRELDRWDLYRLYEDRFLDIFKETQ